MSIDTKNNAPNSAAGRPKPRGHNASNEDFVAREAADAKSALLKAVDDLKTSAANSLDVRRWAERYPLRTAGAAVVAGFVAAALVKGHRSPSVESRNDEPPDNSGKTAQPAEANAATETSTRSAITAMIIAALVDVLKTAAQNFFMNAIRPPQEAAPVDMDQDGEGQD